MTGLNSDEKEWALRKNFPFFTAKKREFSFRPEMMNKKIIIAIGVR